MSRLGDVLEAAGDYARARARLADARRRAAQCEREGHERDASVPSPPGFYFCGRCKVRYPKPRQPEV